MVTAQNHITRISAEEKVREVWREKKGLFGLLTWHELIRADRVGKALVILTTDEPEEIYLNGRLLPTPVV